MEKLVIEDLSPLAKEFLARMQKRRDIDAWHRHVAVRVLRHLDVTREHIAGLFGVEKSTVKRWEDPEFHAKVSADGMDKRRGRPVEPSNGKPPVKSVQDILSLLDDPEVHNVIVNSTDRDLMALTDHLLTLGVPDDLIRDHIGMSPAPC